MFLDVPVGYPSVGDPHFLSVDDPLVAFLLGSGFDAGDIGPGARFSHTIRLNNKTNPLAYYKVAVPLWNMLIRIVVSTPVHN